MVTVSIDSNSPSIELKKLIARESNLKEAFDEIYDSACIDFLRSNVLFFT